MIGAHIQRREDPRLITGHGNYIDDMRRTGMLHMSVVRSPYAHARIRAIDVTEALGSAGVHAGDTARDYRGVLAGGIPAAPAFVPDKKQVPAQYPIAESEACYQGEPVAVVLADDRYLAEDAAQLVSVEYEPLAAVMDLDKAIEPGSPTAHEGAPDNIAWEAIFPGGDIEAAMSEAEVRLSLRITQQRLIPLAMEGRGCIAEWVPFDNRLTLWASTQVPHFVRLFLSGALGISEAQMRVVANDVGGGFGAKIRPYPEEYLACASSRLVGRPVKWIEGRTENLQASTHGRGQIFDLEVGALRDGTLVGLRITQLLDAGAYVGVFGSFQTCAILLGGGCYTFKAVHGRSVGVLTNRVSTDPYRRSEEHTSELQSRLHLV